MYVTNVPNVVRRITVRQLGGAPGPTASYATFATTGSVETQVHVERCGPRRRVSRRARPLHNLLHRTARAQIAALTRYLELHERSNEDERNGFLRDIFDNGRSAHRVFMREMRLDEVFPDPAENDVDDDDYDDDDDCDDDDD